MLREVGILLAILHSALTTIVLPPEYECIADLPDSLSFSEKLINGLQASEILLFSGGHSKARREDGFGKISADSLSALVNRHGYKLLFLDEIDYEKKLVHNNENFGPNWHRIFAMEALKSQQDIKYFVWFDDDIVAPYPETDMINHYINMMESNAEWLILIGDEGDSFILNSGLIFIRNDPQVFEIFKKLIEINCKTRLSWSFPHEQEALANYRKEAGLESRIKVIPHRDGPYNFNTFMRFADHDPVEVTARRGDAFVHFLGMGPKARKVRMSALMDAAERWRQSRPSPCTYPVHITKKGQKSENASNGAMHFVF